MTKIILALGGNVGNVSETFDMAEKKIKDTIGKITLQSSLYKTEPWGNKKQDDFLNEVIIAETSLTPAEVLKNIINIEKELGRQRKKEDQYAPRTIDIDILFYNKKIIDTNDLIVPHPKLHLRNFVLAPLSEVAPEFVHPLLNKKIKDLFVNSSDSSVVEKLMRK